MREKAAEQGRREHLGEGANRERWAHVSIVQKKEDALVLGLDWHFFQSASSGEGYHVMLLGETCFLDSASQAGASGERHWRIRPFLEDERDLWSKPMGGDRVLGKSHMGGQGCWSYPSSWQLCIHAERLLSFTAPRNRQDTSQDTSALGRSLRLHNEKSGQVGLELCFIGGTLESFCWLIYCILGDTLVAWCFTHPILVRP